MVALFLTPAVSAAVIAQWPAGWPKGWEQVDTSALRAGMDPMEALAALRASHTDCKLIAAGDIRCTVPPSAGARQCVLGVIWTITSGMSTVVTCFWDKPDNPTRSKAIEEARARLTFEFGEPIKHSPNQQALHFGHPDYQSAHLSPIGNGVMVSRLVR
jgi:hypothetical protein